MKTLHSTETFKLASCRCPAWKRLHFHDPLAGAKAGAGAVTLDPAGLRLRVTTDFSRLASSGATAGRAIQSRAGPIAKSTGPSWLLGPNQFELSGGFQGILNVRQNHLCRFPIITSKCSVLPKVMVLVVRHILPYWQLRAYTPLRLLYCKHISHGLCFWEQPYTQAYSLV